jgi:methionine-rich copper-binding protein CopC
MAHQSVLTILTCLTLGIPSIASAHDRLLSTVPQADSVASPAPTELRLLFSEEPELALTNVTITRPDETPIVTGPLLLDQSDRTVVVVWLAAPLATGAYLVAWRVVAKDGHPSEGAYGFSVK